MAQMQYVVENKLHEKAREQDAPFKYAAAAIGIIATLLCWVYLGGAVALVVAGICTLSFLAASSPDARFSSGAQGEDLAVDVVRRLPDTYTVFNQLDIPNARSRTGVNEADLVVCGPNAVFVIEVKNNNGTIVCDEKAPNWPIRKVGRGGTAYGKAMRNPVGQCKNLIWALGEHLKGVGAKPWIQGVVLFTSPDAKLIQEGPSSIPVLRPKELLAYIQSFERRSSPEILGRAMTEIAKLRGAPSAEAPAQHQTPPALAAAVQNGPRHRVQPRL
jgi:hypothetical protein